MRILCLVEFYDEILFFEANFSMVKFRTSEISNAEGGLIVFYRILKFLTTEWTEFEILKLKIP